MEFGVKIVWNLRRKNIELFWERESKLQGVKEENEILSFLYLKT